MNTDNLEIERKFLIRYPGPEFFEACQDITDITQTYLQSGQKGRTARVRKRGRDGQFTYTHTVKERISDMRRVEIEREVSLEEYKELLKTADQERRVIYKKRCCIEYQGLLFEIDIYPFWQDRAVMEVELLDEEQQFAFPPQLEIIKEITADKRYTNSSLAKMIPQEEL